MILPLAFRGTPGLQGRILGSLHWVSQVLPLVHCEHMRSAAVILQSIILRVIILKSEVLPNQVSELHESIRHYHTGHAGFQYMRTGWSLAGI